LGEKRFLYLHPAREELYIDKLQNEEFKINSKIILKSLVSLKKMLTFAPALRMKAVLNKEEYVHRHIELTAVSLTRRDKKKESK
jgi:hypothetical protein